MFPVILEIPIGETARTMCSTQTAIVLHLIVHIRTERTEREERERERANEWVGGCESEKGKSEKQTRVAWNVTSSMDSRKRLISHLATPKGDDERGESLATPVQCEPASTFYHGRFPFGFGSPAPPTLPLSLALSLSLSPSVTHFFLFTALSMECAPLAFPPVCAFNPSLSQTQRFYPGMPLKNMLISWGMFISPKPLA